MNVDDFAKRVGFSRAQVYNYLRQKSEPPLSFFQEIRKSFPFVNIEWLITGERHIAAEQPVIYQTSSVQISSRAAAMADNFEALSEDDKRALERIAFSLAQSQQKMKKKAG